MSFQSLQDYETIQWNVEKRLSWDDFRGEIPKNNRAAAITASGITYRFSTSGTRGNIMVDFKIDTYFYPEKSWYQPELIDEVILGHEQLHFDISELYARKMKARLAEETFTHANVKSKVKAIYTEIMKEVEEFQNVYDDETNFSRNREQQSIWNEKIALLLKKE